MAQGGGEGHVEGAAKDIKKIHEALRVGYGQQQVVLGLTNLCPNLD